MKLVEVNQPSIITACSQLRPPSNSDPILSLAGQSLHIHGYLCVHRCWNERTRLRAYIGMLADWGHRYVQFVFFGRRRTWLDFGDPSVLKCDLFSLRNNRGFERIQHCKGRRMARRCCNPENCKSHIPTTLSRVGPAYMRRSCTIKVEVIAERGSSGESLEFPMSYKHSHRRLQLAIHRSHVQCQSVNFGSLERKRMPCVAASGCSATTLAAYRDDDGRTKENYLHLEDQVRDLVRRGTSFIPLRSL